jgi:UDP-N-acetylmuramate dehydrogenase
MFKEHLGRYLILRVIYRLSNEFVPNLSYKALEALPHNTAQQLRNAITDLRWSKLPRPEEHGSAGSFFKNPVVDEGIYTSIKAKYADMPDAHKTNDGYKLSAGWLIDRAGWKGKTMGRAGVWPNNALVLYNSGGCTGEEVVALAQAIVADVQTKFGITLEPEAIII